jgi:hypothetical protein
MIKLYGDNNERFLASARAKTHLEYLTTKEILFDWKQSAEGLNTHDDEGRIKREDLELNID